VWRGTAFGGVKGRSQLPSYVDQYPEGVIRIDPMITHNLRLDQVNEAFELMHEGKSIHSVIHFRDSRVSTSTYGRSCWRQPDINPVRDHRGDGFLRFCCGQTACSLADFFL
jgi:hypothetical protein